jgi:raffinose/stachyose/melibiose transport system substrate-binding protein/xylobiose transport system substrate-binding protein
VLTEWADDVMRESARRARAVGCVLTAVAVLAGTGCGTAGPAAGSRNRIQVWALQDPQNGPIINRSIAAFNQSSDVDAELRTYINDAYKQKLQVSMGSPNAPDVFLNWGGGNLAQYVDADQVVDLTEALRTSAGADLFLPSVLEVGRINGKQFALPMNGIQPVVLFYNKKVFARYGLALPKTYDELLGLVERLKREGVIPIALPGLQGWTELMYLEYLLDRVGGPDKFAAIAGGSVDAWRDPAMLRALELCQQLAQRGAFGSNFAGINYDNRGASKLFATGKAAMFLMGSWEYASQASTNPSFVKSGELGWMPFPSVPGGAGDPANVVGNPSNYFSVSIRSVHRDRAADFVVATTASKEYISALIGTGQVPAVKGVEPQLAASSDAEFALFTYRLVADAPAFTQSWDQALSPSVASELLTNLQKLFLSDISPEEFVAAMVKAR